jgi:hypothetical protein
MSNNPTAGASLERNGTIVDNPHRRRRSGFAGRDRRYPIGARLFRPGCSNGYEALRVPIERRVDLLIADVVMPGISGFALARQARVMRPKLQVIYLSGKVGT